LDISALFNKVIGMILGFGAYPGPPPKIVFRGGTERNCRDGIAKRRNREPDKVDRAYVIEGHPECDDG
jgi:hypothetical protein